jgi:hypothetical protein
MPKFNIDISGGLYQSSSPIVANLACENCYVNIPQVQGALSPANLFGTPGVTQESTTGNFSKVNRGAHVKAGKPYFVNGTTLYRTDETIVDGVEVLVNVSLGTVTGTDRVSMADNGTQLMIIDPASGNGWIMDESAGTPFAPITDLDYVANGQPKYVVFNDSFFIVTTDSKKFIKSDSNNGLSWNALDFGTAEKDPDDIVAPVTFRGELFIAGTETIQSFNNIGGAAGADFPYQASGLILAKGVFAPLSLIETNNTFMFIGGGVNESPAIWASNGGEPVKISTTAIDSALQQFTAAQIEQAFAWTYAQSGAYFVGFSLPTRAFVYDTISQKWHERTSKVIDSKGFTQSIRWRVNSLVTAYNKILVGDSQDGRIGSLDLDTYTEYDSEIRRTFSTIPLQNQGDSVSVSEVEITMQAGVGSFVLDPQIRMSWSDDGHLFNNELSRGIGKIGEYTRRAIWYRLGRAPRFRVFKFEYSEPEKFAVIRLDARVRGGQRGR